MQKLGAKLIIIGMVCLAFFVGLMFVSSLVDERQSYHDTVISDIKSSHVSSQLLATPFFVVHDGDETRYLFATKSDIKGGLTVRDDEYKRGIYRAVSYQSNLSITQEFDPKKVVAYAPEVQTQEEQSGEEAVTEEASTPKLALKPTPERMADRTRPLKLVIAISDLRGVKPSQVHVNGMAYPVQFNSDNTLALPYLEAVLPITEEMFFAGVPLKVQIELEVAGIGGFGVMPLGDAVGVSLNSNWQNPKFSGQALPTQKTLTDEGFVATWQSHALGTQNQKHIMQIAQGIMGGYDTHTNQALMTDFIHVNDTYTQTDRSIKYALLIIMVSFGTFFLFEVIKACAIHPIQYLLVASALCVFYLLLLSLAEQIVFLYAYIIASVACVGLIGWYACYMLGSVGRGVGFGVVLSLLYVAFYVILSASGLNLLLGSVFLFVCIAVVMVATRHVDWYSVARYPHKVPSTDEEDAHE